MTPIFYTNLPIEDAEDVPVMLGDMMSQAGWILALVVVLSMESCK